MNRSALLLPLFLLLSSAPATALPPMTPSATLAPDLEKKLDSALTAIGRGKNNQCNPNFAGGNASLVIGITHQGQHYTFTRGKHRETFTAGSGFGIASISKTFTGLLIHELIREGKLSLETVANDILPGRPLPLSADGREIRIFDLITHSSGLPRNSDLNEVDPYEGHDLARVSRFLESNGLEYQPRTHYLYANLGFALLAAVVEQIEGKRYAEVLRTRVTEPLGMRFTDPEMPDAALTPAFHVDGTRAEPWHLNHLYVGGGGIRSTASDLLKYLDAMIASASNVTAMGLARSMQNTLSFQHGYVRRLTFFGPSPLVQAGTPHYFERHHYHVSMPWFGRADQGLYSHGGSIAGNTSWIGFLREPKSGVVVFSNSSGIEGSGLCLELIGKEMLGFLKGDPLLGIPVELETSSDLQDFLTL